MDVGYDYGRFGYRLFYNAVLHHTRATICPTFAGGRYVTALRLRLFVYRTFALFTTRALLGTFGVDLLPPFCALYTRVIVLIYPDPLHLVIYLRYALYLFDIPRTFDTVRPRLITNTRCCFFPTTHTAALAIWTTLVVPVDLLIVTVD